MNIAFVSTHINTGGITSYLFTLAKGLIQRGHRIFIISSGGDREEEFKKIGATVFILDIQTKSEINFKLWKAVPKLSQYCTNNKIQILHAHTRVTQVLCAQVSRKVKIPYVTTCHGFFKRRLGRILFPCWGERVIAISEQVYDHLANDFRVSSSQLVLIPTGIDVEEFALVTQKQREENRKKMNITDGPVIGMIARLSDVKGQDVLIDAMKGVVPQFPSIQCLLVGQGKMEGRLRADVERNGLQNNVQFLPIVQRTQEMLSVLDVCIVPSRQEGLGLSVMEAQVSGIPVIASRVGGLKSLITDGETGYFVRSEDPQKLTEKIISVLNNLEEARGVGLTAREFILKNWSSEKTVNQVQKLYTSLIT